MVVPRDFFTIQSLMTLSGVTGATFVICNGLQRAFDVNPKWLGLAVAQILVLLGVYLSGGQTLVDYFIGIINGFLVFCTARGATGALAGNRRTRVVGRGSADAENLPASTSGRRTFLTPWF